MTNSLVFSSGRRSPDSLNQRLRRRIEALVVVYSCRSYLPTRVAALRRTWLRQSLPTGVKLLIVVGDDGTGGALPVDVVGLPCGDSYEDLPLKTLALARYVHEVYDVGTLIKVDDDCYVADVGRLVDASRGVDYVGFSRDVRDPDRQGDGAGPQLPRRFCYGGTYALSGRVVAFLAENGARLGAGQRYEDVMVGRAVEELGDELRAAVPPSAPLATRHDPRFSPMFEKPFWFVCVCLPESVSLMHLTPRRIVALQALRRHASWALLLLATLAERLTRRARRRRGVVHLVDLVTPL